MNLYVFMYTTCLALVIKEDSPWSGVIDIPIQLQKVLLVYVQVMWLLITLFRATQLKLVLQCTSRSSMLGSIPSHRLNFRNCTLERPALAYTRHHWADFLKNSYSDREGRREGGRERKREESERERQTENASFLRIIWQMLHWLAVNQLNFANVSFYWLFPKQQIKKSLRSRLVVAVYHGSLHVVHMYWEALKFKHFLITMSSDSFQVCSPDTVLWQPLYQCSWPKAEKKIAALPSSLCMYNCPLALRSIAQACR